MPRLQLVADLPGHTDPAWSVAFNPTKPILASSSTDKTVRLYSYTFPSTSASDEPTTTAASANVQAIPTITYHSTLPTDTHKRTIRSLAWSPSGTSLATGSFDSTIGVWEQVDSSVSASDEEDGAEGVYRPSRRTESEGEKRWECVTTLDGHESEVKSVGYSSDGALLASCSRDKSVWVWEVQPDSDFECIAVMMEHTQDVKCLTWHPKEEILASGSYDASILLFADDPDGDWSPFQKLQPKKTAVAPSKAIKPAALAHGSISIPPLKEAETVWSLSFSPCGRYLASGGDGGGVRLWQRTGKSTESPWVEMGHWEGHNGRACFSLAWQAAEVVDEEQVAEKNKDEDEVVGRLVSGGGDGQIILWEATKKPDGRLELSILDSVQSAHSISDVNCVTFCRRTPSNPDVKPTAAVREVMRQTRAMVASCGDDGSVKVWMVLE